MENVRLNIYLAKELLGAVLNISNYNTTILNKRKTWFVSKMNRVPYKNVPVGFDEDDLVLINASFKKIVEICRKGMLELPSACGSREVYAYYVKNKMEETGKIIKLSYLRSKYMKMSATFFIQKKNANANKSKYVYSFNDKEIENYNRGLEEIAQTFEHLVLTL